MNHSDLAVACLTHLELERALLEQLLAIMQAMRQAMLSRDQDQVGQIIESAQQIDLQPAAESRDRVRDQIAAALQVPREQATIRLLRGHCDADLTARLEESSERTRVVAVEVNRLAAANGSLAFQLWQIMDRFFCALGGDQAAPQVYERTGHRRIA